MTNLQDASERQRAKLIDRFPGAKIVTLKSILDMYNRIPFSEYELEFLMEFFHGSRRKGRDISIGFPRTPYLQGDIKKMTEDGILPVHSPSQLDTGFLFVKSDGGRSLLGRQKAVYPSFVGEMDHWIVGPTFKRFELAITSIGNVYRGEGLR